MYDTVLENTLRTSRGVLSDSTRHLLNQSIIVASLGEEPSAILLATVPLYRKAPLQMRAATPHSGLAGSRFPYQQGIPYGGGAGVTYEDRI